MMQGGNKWYTASLIFGGKEVYIELDLVSQYIIRTTQIKDFTNLSLGKIKKKFYWTSQNCHDWEKSRRVFYF